MSTDDTIDFRDQIEAYLADPMIKHVTLTLLSGDKYFASNADDIALLQRVVFVFQGGSFESCFPFEAVCNIDAVSVGDR